MTAPPEAPLLCCVGAHPDDIELAFGGLVLRALALGMRVHLLDLTRGERGTRGSGPRRAVEARRAARVLGVGMRCTLSHPDGALAAASELQGELEALWARHRPAVVATHRPDDPHPDHRAAHRWVSAALSNCAGGTELVLGAKALPGGRQGPGEPRWILPLDAAQWQLKWAALRCHRSQWQPAGPWDRGQHLPDGQDILARARSTAEHYGQRIGQRFGEPLWHDGDPPARILRTLLP